MKKMLVVFLILFSKVLADSEENSYVDLLPEKEKQQFLDKVASRILEDVESPENVTDVPNVEISDKLLSQHSEYVKTVFKEEQANLRKSRGNVAKEITASSDEKDNLDVKPLKVKRMSEPVDLTSQEKDSSGKTAANNTTIKNISNNVTVSNITIQNDNDNKTSESKEATSETLNKVSETNSTNEKWNEEQATKEKTKNGNVTIKAKVLSTNSTEEDTTEKDSKEIEPSDNSDDNDEVVLEKSKSGLDESDTRNVSVKSIHESARKSAGNITEGNTTTTAVEFSSSKSAENISVTYNNVSSAEGEITTALFADEGNATMDSLSMSISSESASNESNSIENTTTDTPSESTTTTTKDKDVEPLTKSTTLENDSRTTTESPQSSTAANEETTEFLPKTVTESESSEEKAETTTLPVTTEHTTAKPFDTTREMNITVEDFTSAPKRTSTAGSTTVTPPLKKPKKKTPPDEDTAKLNSDEDTMEASTQEHVNTIKISTNKKVKHKAIIYKLPAVIVGTKGEKMAEEESEVENKNFVELKKVYFDKDYKDKVGKEYHVFEIPDGGTPFLKEKEPEAEQPYYVPVYNYSPNNAYFNPLNRLGPNPGDKEGNLHIIENNDDLNFDDDDDDDFNQQIERTETINVEMKYDKSYDRQRKKFGSKQTIAQGLHKHPSPNNEEHNTHGKVNPEDYLDSDYYFGRIRNNIARQNEFGGLPDSVPGGTLKDHVRAVRNLMYQYKTVGTFQNNERNRRVGISQDDFDLFKDADDEKNGNNFHKVGYLKGENKTKEVFVMDDVFKANFDKFIQEKVLTPLPIEATTFKNLENDEDSENMKPDKSNISNQSVKFSLRRSGVIKVSIYLQVLNDMVTLDNKALVRYDWLGTTVDIQAALQKLFELTALVGNNEDIHPADMEILNYVLFLHNLATEIIEANDLGAQLKKKLAHSSNKKHKPLRLNQKGLINRLWLYLRKEVPKEDDYNALNHLKQFLMNVEDGLFDLHEAIKNIAMITKYNKQRWYQNLKDLYINLDEKHLLELLLHITTLRLFALIEESAKNGLEEDYIQYMKENKDHSKNTLQEMIFIMKILDEYKRFVE